MPLHKTLLAASLFGLFAAAQAQTDLQALEVFPCDGNGNPKTVAVGEKFWVRMNFRVSGTPNSSYKFRVETDYAKLDSGRLSFGTAPGDYWVYWGPIPTLMDGPVTVKATLDPERRVREGNRSNNTLSFVLRPTSPSQPIEYFAPQNLSGRVGIEVLFRRNSAVPTNLTTWIPTPPTEGFQSVSSTALADGYRSAVSDPFDQFLAARTWQPSSLATVREEMQLSSVARSMKINFEQLSRMGNSSDPEMNQWLRAEQLVELSRPEFRAWVNAVVAERERPGPSTVEVAQKLYRSILQKCTYERSTGAEPSAYRTLRTKKGDCGALSSLFVALCRTAGIPARTVSGFMVGTDNWHIWAEFHVNGAGWVPVDPTFAEGRLGRGMDLPIYFGVIPELNERAAMSLGFDRELGGRSVKMLQSPAIFWQGRNVKVQRITNFSELRAN